MSFPTTGVLDDFSRADGAIGASYSDEPFNDGTTSVPELSSNQVRAGGVANNYQSVWWNVAQYGPDVEAYIDIPALGSTATYTEFYVYLRLQQPSSASSTGDGYSVWVVSSLLAWSLQIYRHDNGIATQLGSTQTGGGITFSAGDSLGASMIGSSLQAWRKTGGSWATLGTPETDATYAGAGYIGFGWYEDARTHRVDNLGGGTIIVPSRRRTLTGVGR